MRHLLTILLTALAPAIWGTTYLVTSQWLPDGAPITAAVVRSLPAGLILVAMSRYWPARSQWPRLLLLALLNIACFQPLLFLAAYRLPGGVAAVIGALQPLLILGLGWAVQGLRPRALSVLACLAAVAGMALLLLTPDAATRAAAQGHWDGVGLAAAMVGSVSMALGTFFSKYWSGQAQNQPQAPALPLTAFVGWQLVLGGLALWPLAWWVDPALPALETQHLLGYGYLALFGSLLSYLLWFDGLRRLTPVAVSSLGLLSPLTAFIIGWVWLDQRIEGLALLGFTTVMISILIVQWSQTGGRLPALPMALKMKRSPHEPCTD